MIEITDEMVEAATAVIVSYDYGHSFTCRRHDSRCLESRKPPPRSTDAPDLMLTSNIQKASLKPLMIVEL